MHQSSYSISISFAILRIHFLMWLYKFVKGRWALEVLHSHKCVTKSYARVQFNLRTWINACKVILFLLRAFYTRIGAAANSTVYPDIFFFSEFQYPGACKGRSGTGPSSFPGSLLPLETRLDLLFQIAPCG